MVLCKIDKYYNQVKFQVLWPRLKVGSNTVTFTVKIWYFLDLNRIARNRLFERLYL